MDDFNNGDVVSRPDSCLGVRFFYHAVEDELASAQAGIKKFKDIEMVEILIPGSKDITHRRVTDDFRRRFSAQYEQFKKTSENKIEGTPLNEFPFISAAERKELEYFNIFTGEQLANMPDGNIDKIGVNGRDLIKKVKAFMQLAKDTSIVSRMTDENENLKREMELLKEQMQQIINIKQQESDNNVKQLRKTKAA